MSTHKEAPRGATGATPQRGWARLDFNAFYNLSADRDRIQLRNGYGKPYVGPFSFEDARTREPVTVYADEACRVPYPLPAATDADGQALAAFTRPGQNVQLVIHHGGPRVSRFTFPPPRS